MSDADTIAALASGAGRAGIGVVRISGPAVPELIHAVIGVELPPRVARAAKFMGAGGEVIDQGIALYFRGPRSYTGEDVLELQGHGGPVVLRMLLKRCLDLGARLAEPGEFTRRAFLNDKLDLAQAEAVADLIDAASEQAARCALRSLQGEFSAHVQRLQAALTDLRVLLEATLDFPEEDLEFLQSDHVGTEIGKLVSAVARALTDARRGSLLREGVRVALIGPPNVGKSSIINVLCKEDVAIVSPVPGTTRDRLRQAVEIQGLPVHVVDTAGLRPTDDTVEALGVARTWETAADADIVLLVSDLSAPDAMQVDAIRAQLAGGTRCIHVRNKADLVSRAASRESTPQGIEVCVSARTGAGVDLLEDAIVEAAGWQPQEAGTFIARERHIRALELCRQRLEAARATLGEPELVAEELRLAQAALSQVTGELASDDLLGEIFSRFCIGK